MSFWKTVFASFIGYILYTVIAFFLFIVFISIIAIAGSDSKGSIKDNSVLYFDLSTDIEERASNDPFSSFTGSGEKKAIGLHAAIKAIQAAAKDDRIKGIYLKMSSFGAGMATAQSIREALLNFKASNKFVYAYGEMFSELSYYVGSVADSVFIYPTGMMEWNGLASNPIFLKGMFDKLEVQPVLFRVGKFKSAGEMFTEKQMSEPNRKQIQLILNDLWGVMLKDIALSRKLSEKELTDLATTLKIDHATAAVKHRLVDATIRDAEFRALLKSRCGIESDKKLRQISLSEYIRFTKSPLEETSGRKIAVIYAVGDIVDGEAEDGSVGSATLSEAIRQAREDDNVKAVVLRVNSPGGSALASDVIAYEVELTKKVKPVIASYGEVAASGGYYISAGCDKIVCQPTTITGSIGVFGLLWNAKGFLENKVGINVDRVYSYDNASADLGNPNRSMTDFEKAKIQGAINRIYGDFIAVVKKGRSYSDSIAVDSIAQGRVWTGLQAKRLKLVDEFGGMETALKLAASKAGLGDDYTVATYPKQKTTLERVLSALNTSIETRVLNKMLSVELRQALRVQQRFKPGVYAILPETYRFE